MNSTACTAIVIAVVGGALGQILMKIGMQSVSIHSPVLFLQDLQSYPLAFIALLAGILAYLVSMIIWVLALKQFKLSTAYPILSLGYVLVYILAAILPGLQESITTEKTIGIALIMFGVWFSNKPSASRSAA